MTSKTSIAEMRCRLKSTEWNVQLPHTLQEVWLWKKLSFLKPWLLIMYSFFCYERHPGLNLIKKLLHGIQSLLSDQFFGNNSCLLWTSFQIALLAIVVKSLYACDIYLLDHDSWHIWWSEPAITFKSYNLQFISYLIGYLYNDHYGRHVVSHKYEQFFPT